jgi:hypothetical protein
MIEQLGIEAMASSVDVERYLGVEWYILLG